MLQTVVSKCCYSYKHITNKSLSPIDCRKLKYDILLASVGITSVTNFVRIGQLVQRLKRRYIYTEWRCHKPMFFLHEQAQLSRTTLGYGLDDWGGGGDSSPDRGYQFFSSPSRSDGLWGPASLLHNRHQKLFPWGGGGGKAAGTW
jgi:hypothetical protein